MKRVLAVLSCLSLFLFTADAARGAALLAAAGSGTLQTVGGGTPGLDRVLGYSFTVGTAPLDATSLGFWDYQKDGLSRELHVALWDNQTDTLLASVIVPSGTGGRLEGEFRYVDLADAVRLEAGKTYTLGYRRTLTHGGTIEEMDFASPTVSPDVTIATGRLRTWDPHFLPGSLSYFTDQYPQYPIAPLDDQRPTQDLGGDGALIVGPNLLYNVVPEPASLALVACGATMLLRRAR